MLQPGEIHSLSVAIGAVALQLLVRDNKPHVFYLNDGININEGLFKSKYFGTQTGHIFKILTAVGGAVMNGTSLHVNAKEIITNKIAFNFVEIPQSREKCFKVPAGVCDYIL